MSNTVTEIFESSLRGAFGQCEIVALTQSRAGHRVDGFAVVRRSHSPFGEDRRYLTTHLTLHLNEDKGAASVHWGHYDLTLLEAAEAFEKQKQHWAQRKEVEV